MSVAARFVGAFILALPLVALPVGIRATPRQGPVARPPAKRLPAPPTLPLIRIEVARDHVLVLQDVRLGRGDWVAGDLDAFVAFGAPGIPRAIDARLYAATDDVDAVSDAASFESIVIERAFRRPGSARLLLGSSTMAGAVLHLRDAPFRRATAMTGAARVRLRTLLDLPVPDVRTGREIVVRLGAYEGEPYALGMIEVASDEAKPWVTRAEAHLCGPEADPWPLVVRLRSTLTMTSQAGTEGATSSPIAPVLSVRHATDDLCVRFWTTPEK